MKKIFVFFSFLMLCVAANAQYHYQDLKNSQMLRHAECHAPCRQVIVIPQVNGYNVYKADLHCHSIFSDGHVLPKFRVREAWMDGLDIIAATDHIEHRPNEAVFYEYLQRYAGQKYVKPHKGLKAGDPMVDLNFAVGQYQKEALKFGILIIPGSEITRSGEKVGHFNALFTTDNNLIYDRNPVQAIRNAKAQGALVQHNHPGWCKTSIDYTDAERQAYEEGLIDGVEVMNGSEFYPGIIDRVREKGLFISANTDVHASTAKDYRFPGHLRPMTLILAKDKSLESIKEALVAKRTIAWGFDNLCGEEELLRDLFLSSVSLTQLQENRYQLVNMSSIPYIVKENGENPIRLEQFSAIIIDAEKETGLIRFPVLNMWTGAETHLEIEINTNNK